MSRVRQFLFVLYLAASVQFIHFLIWPEAWFNGAHFYVGTFFYPSLATCSGFHLWFFRRGPDSERVGAVGMALWTWPLFVMWLLILYDVAAPAWLGLPAIICFFSGLILVIVGERMKVRERSKGDDHGSGPLWLPRGPIR